MRDFEERKAEVFRRSEKRIKERKARRNHILMDCVPLVLCLTILGTFLFPGEVSKDSGNPLSHESAMGGLTEERYESLTCPIAEITVTGSDFSQSYTNAADLLLIADQLYSYGKRGSEYNGITGIEIPGNEIVKEEGKESADDFSDSIADAANAGYTITLAMQKGEKTEYYLEGNILKNLTSNQTYQLTQIQVNELHELLGIPDR